VGSGAACLAAQAALWRAALWRAALWRAALLHPRRPGHTAPPHPASPQTPCTTPPPLCSELRIQELAQPKTAYWDKHARAKEEAEAAQLSSIPFKPRTGRGPRHRQGPQGPVEERLHGAHDALKLER
jgi:hypothetical protein